MTLHTYTVKMNIDAKGIVVDLVGS